MENTIILKRIRMFYLITDQENKSWNNVQWGENVTHQEDNPNYHFTVYNSPQTALYMYPAYEGTSQPKLWTAQAEFPSRSEAFRSKFPKITTLKEFSIDIPTNEQRFTFGILCCLNLVVNPFFRDWAINYLKGIDQSPETAIKVNEKLNSFIGATWLATPENEYTECAHTILTAVTINDPFQLPASAALRAYYDAIEMTMEINLEQTAQIVNIMPANEIAELL